MEKKEYLGYVNGPKRSFNSRMSSARVEGIGTESGKALSITMLMASSGCKVKEPSLFLITLMSCLGEDFTMRLNFAMSVRDGKSVVIFR